MTASGAVGVKKIYRIGEFMKPIATVIKDNLFYATIETVLGVSLAIGTPLYLAEPFAEIGSPLGGGFFAGEMILNGELFAMIVAPKAEGEAADVIYKGKDRDVAYGADSDEDGLANCEHLNYANHPAAQFCRSLQIGGYDDWYLPSRDELMMLCRNLGPWRKNTPELFREGAAEALVPQWYWSSTEHASYSNYAWVVDFYGGSQGYYNMNYSFGVRAVRRLKI